MSRLAWTLLATLSCLLHVSPTHAHFLFTRIGPHAEAGRSVEVFFSEYAEAGDPRFVDKIDHTKLWIQSTPGKFQPLVVRKATDRLRAFLPASGPVAVVGQCEYGVLTRKVPFLLQYYPKAVSGDAKAVNAMKPRKELPLEIMATFGSDGVTLAALQDGKAVPEAQFTTVDDDLFNEKLKADKSGRVTWKPEYPGHFCVYTNVTVKKAGECDGKRYSEIRRFATLSFHWPLVRSEPDEEAVAMFEKAIATRSAWKDFPGFTAEVSGVLDGREFTGKVRAGDDGSVDVKLDDKTATAWVEDQLGSIILHRMSSSRRKKPVLYFGDDDESHPLGRLLTFVGGRFASSYRVKDGKITVVNRNLGPQNMTITVLDNQKNADGKYLPHSYTVQYWDAKDGRLLRTETIQNGWHRVGTFDLPTGHTVTTASSTGLSVRSLTLSEHRLLRRQEP